MNFILELVFLICQYDLVFVSRFRELSKECKKFSETWLTEITDPKFLRNIDVSIFINLKRLKCDRYVTDQQLQKLRHIVDLDISGYSKVTDNGIIHLKLHTLNASHNRHITDKGIAHMNLHTLYASYN
jgi:hypothetical protein